MKVIGSRCFPIPDGIDIFYLNEEIEATEMTALVISFLLVHTYTLTLPVLVFRKR